MFEGQLNLNHVWFFGILQKGGVCLHKSIHCALFAFALSSSSVLCSPPDGTDSRHVVPSGGKAEAREVKPLLQSQISNSRMESSALSGETPSCGDVGSPLRVDVV